jgi:hypothetical protein
MHPRWFAFVTLLLCSAARSSVMLPSAAAGITSTCPCIALHYDALMDFYDATGGALWLNQAGWSYNAQCWFGVKCGGINSSDVTELSLPKNQLSGTLPASLGTIAGLEYLDVSNNQLTGTLPAAWSLLSMLRFLYLSNNMLYGVFPPSWAGDASASNPSSSSLGLASLQRLALNNNCLFGSLPLSIADGTAFPRLMTLNVCNTKLTRWGARNVVACVETNSNRWPAACDLLPRPPRTLSASLRSHVTTLSRSLSSTETLSCPSRFDIFFPIIPAQCVAQSCTASMYIPAGNSSVQAASSSARAAQSKTCSDTVPLVVVSRSNSTSFIASSLLPFSSESSSSLRGDDNGALSGGDEFAHNTTTWSLILASSQLLSVPSSSSLSSDVMVIGTLTVLIPFVVPIGWTLVGTTNATTFVTIGSSNMTSATTEGNITYTMPYAPSYSNTTVVSLMAMCVGGGDGGMSAPMVVVEVRWPPPPPPKVNSAVNGAATGGAVFGVLTGSASSASSTAMLALLQCTKDPPVTTATYFVSLFFQLGLVAVAMGNVVLILIAFILHAALVFCLMTLCTSTPKDEPASGETDPDGDARSREKRTKEEEEEEDKKKKKKKKHSGGDHEATSGSTVLDVWLPSMATLRFPAATINIMALLIPGSFLGATAGILNRTSAGDVITCIIALVCVFGLIVAQWVLQRHVVLPRVKYLPYRSFAVGSAIEQTLLFPRSRWEPLALHSAFNPLLSPLKPKYIMTFTTLELLLACAIGAVGGAFIGGVCDSPLLAIAASLQLLFGVALAVLRPHRMPFDRVLRPVIHLLLGTVCAMRYVDLTSATSETLLLIVSGLQAVAGACNLYVALFREKKLRRGDPLRTFDLTEEEEYRLQHHHKTNTNTDDDRYVPFVKDSSIAQKFDGEELEVIVKQSSNDRESVRTDNMEDAVLSGNRTILDESAAAKNCRDAATLLKRQETQKSIITEASIRASSSQRTPSSAATAASAPAVSVVTDHRHYVAPLPSHHPQQQHHNEPADPNIPDSRDDEDEDALSSPFWDKNGNAVAPPPSSMPPRRQHGRWRSGSVASVTSISLGVVSLTEDQILAL